MKSFRFEFVPAASDHRITHTADTPCALQVSPLTGSDLQLLSANSIPMLHPEFPLAPNRRSLEIRLSWLVIVPTSTDNFAQLAHQGVSFCLMVK